MEDMNKGIAVISGAFGYVGKTLATTLAKKGFRLILLYQSTSPHDVQNFLSSLPGDNHVTFQCDLTNAGDVHHVISTVHELYGEVSLCVHAAGLKPERKKLLQTSAASFARQLEVNGMGGFNFLTNVASIMKEGGTIVGITTIGVVNTEAAKSLGGYIPAKYVLQGILSMLREELLPRKVFVYALAPGFMEDGMNKDIPKAFVEMVKTKSKTKQLATAEGIAERVMSLHENKDQQKPLTITYAPEYE